VASGQLQREQTGATQSLFQGDIRKGLLGTPTQSILFGWILFGPAESGSSCDIHNCNANNELDTFIQNFWIDERINLGIELRGFARVTARLR